MHVDVNGTRLWFDVEGAGLVPDGREMRARPTLVLVHGGPGSFDHSYFKPDFARLADSAQVVYLDLRGHGRSEWGALEDWTFEGCADDVRAFCDAVGIAKPVVYGHSLGGPIVLLYGARHPGHAAGLVVQSAFARFDVPRLADAYRRVGGDELGALAARDFGGEEVTADEAARVFAGFGPHVPDDDQLARRRQNLELNPYAWQLVLQLDIREELGRITSPTLVLAGDLDPVTPPAAAEEILAGLAPGVGELDVMEGTGHWPWLDAPDRYFSRLTAFVLGSRP